MASRIERLADLIVNFGANVQEGQILDVGSGLGKEELTRAITASAYRRGAKFVDVHYWDPHLKRERVLFAPDDVLDFVPPWYGERALQLGNERGATISLSGPIEPHLFDDLDPGRLGRDVFPRVKEWTTVINERTARLSEPRAGGRARQALGACRSHLPSGRRRSGGLLAGPKQRSEGRGKAPDRPAVRCDPSRRAGNRLDRRTAADLALDGRWRRDSRRNPTHGEPSDRGGLHLT
jgi:hypothetical protein